MASSGIKIYLFLSESYKEEYNSIVGPLPNVTIEIIELIDLHTYKCLSTLVEPCTLPTMRTAYKDTQNYMILMNSKIEFIHRVMEKVNATHYGWVDFSLFHVITNIQSGIEYLKVLDYATLKDGLYIPGCWNNNRLPSFNSISWRFCGGFFIGDKESVNNFYIEHNNLFISIVEVYGLTWEVNIWAWLEHIGHLKCVWFKADHNDSIIRLPVEAFVNC
jgi:hypothetical protein